MNRLGARQLAPYEVVAAFDSATVLRAGLAAALHGRPFPHLGHSGGAAAAVRVGGRLPWPLLRWIYTRIGASEGINPHRLAEVDMAAVAQWLAKGYPQRRYPAALVGSSNGALTHLAAALQVPWLPGTVLVPVARSGDPQRPVDALRFGERFAPRLLDSNPDVVLHHMHDQIQDTLMVARMTYFRTKWRNLPDAYARFLTEFLAPGAPVILIEDLSCWPVVRIGERHVFQPGAQGGCPPQGYLRRPHTPQPDEEAPEAEWGANPDLGAALTAWCTAHKHPLVRVTYSGPQAPAHAVATVMRNWYIRRGEPADRLLIPSFIVGDPWRTINAAAVPFWTFFSVQSALQALEAHLQLSTPYRIIDILLFQHGVRSDGIASPDQWLSTARRHGATAQLLALDHRRFPHDIASLGRYGHALADLPPARRPWSPLDLDEAIPVLRTAGLHIHQ
ncbi:MAG: hypothetical protein JO115_14450 [Pseudonocardiales bacterium]|nr:hypothetical protein [Pseudonocardiales bacterium]